MNRLAVAGSLVAVLSGCASHVLLKPEERAALERQYEGGSREQFLRVSVYVTPFFGDASKRLLTPYPPAEVRLLNDTSGQPISPGAIEKILPAGTRVRIKQVEFPTGLNVAERVLYSPRTQPWVYLDAAGDQGALPLILVLRPQLKDRSEFEAELSRYLSSDDPKPILDGFSDGVRAAIREKRVLAEMTPEAAERALGEPERKKISYEEGKRREQWLYPGGRRVVHFFDGRLERLEEAAEQP